MLVLAACGASRTPSARSSTHAATFLSETPEQILKTAARAADSAASFRISARIKASNVPTRTFTIAVVYPTRLSVAFVQARAREEVISVPTGTYVKANLAGLEDNLPKATARRYANQWLTLPGSAGATVATKFRAILRTFAARSVACTLAQFPNPTRVGTTTVAGQASVELHSNGPSDRDSEKLWIAAAAPHFPLLLEITRHSAEAPLRSCPGVPGAKAASGYGSYSDWNAVTITAPARSTPVS
jgi:hypothetical protein